VYKRQVELQEMKYGNRLKVSIKYDKNSLNRKVAPLILFPFVENCYKHGCSNDPSRPTINIELKTHDDKISCLIENSKPVTMIQSEKKKHGIGIKNTMKRLEILYPDRHCLKVEERKDTFKVELFIEGEPINDNVFDDNVNLESHLAFN
jgi:LytS/YehU family sensor histidine kinase